MSKTRVTYLDRVQNQRLQDWARIVRRSFVGAGGPYLVGSAIERADWRDVDVRLILADAEYDALAAVLDVDRLGFVFAAWGQQATGLPVDFQVQRQTEANERHPGRRNALGIGVDAVKGDGGPA